MAMHLQRSAPRGAFGGFTLLEVLVVMSLLSLLMLAMASALRATAQTEERVDQRLVRADEMRVANDFLRSVLGRVSAQKSNIFLPDSGDRMQFEGTAGSLTWVGIMPARFGTGGRFFFRLANVQGALVLLYLPWDGNKAPAWASAQSYTLVSEVSQLAFQYQGGTAEPPVWVDVWASSDELPQRVLISLSTKSAAWPALVVAMRVLPGSDPRGSGGATFGGDS